MAYLIELGDRNQIHVHNKYIPIYVLQRACLLAREQGDKGSGPITKQ